MIGSGSSRRSCCLRLMNVAITRCCGVRGGPWLLALGLGLSVVFGLAVDSVCAGSTQVVIVGTSHKKHQAVAEVLATHLKRQSITYQSVLLPRHRVGRAAAPTDDSPGKSSAGSDGDEEAGPPDTREAVGQNADLKAALRQIVAAEPGVILAVGTWSTRVVLDVIPQTPVVFCMVPHVLDAPFADAKGPAYDRVAGVTTDVDPAVQLGWIAQLRQPPRRLGILFSDHSKETAQQLREVAGNLPFEVELIEAQRDHFPDAVAALGKKRCDGVLMLPDAAVFNSANVQRLLIWGLRGKSPVFSFSAKITKAGGFASVEPSNGKLIAQAVELVRTVLDGAKPANVGIQYPRALSYAVNERTSEIIDCSLPREFMREGILRFAKR